MVVTCDIDFGNSLFMISGIYCRIEQKLQVGEENPFKIIKLQNKDVKTNRKDELKELTINLPGHDNAHSIL